jgi:uncharacterized Zn-finger protein
MVEARAAPEVIEVETTEVSCDGGEGALGHPRVFLNMGDKREVECPYCDRLFKLKNGVKPRDAH